MIAMLALLLAMVNATYNPPSYACDGSTAAFTINFPYQASGDVVATSTTAGGVVTTLVITTDYTLSVSNTSQTNAVLTILVPATKCPSGSTLKIFRNVSRTQPYGFRGQTNFIPSLHENAYDRIEMQIQETVALGGPNTWLATQTFAPSGASSATAIVAVGGAPNGDAVTATGTGTGRGVVAVGGATNAAGVVGTGGATNGVGVSGTGAGSGTGITGQGGPTATAVGVVGTGSGAGGRGVVGFGVSNSQGVDGIGAGTGSGTTGTGGGTSGTGVAGTGGAPNGIGVGGQGTGSGVGGNFTGGATGTGVTGLGGSSGGPGGSFTGTGNGNGVGGQGAGTGVGVSGTGGATNGAGVQGSGVGSGPGGTFLGGSVGAGVNGQGGATSGNGGNFTANNGNGLQGTGGSGGAGLAGQGQGTGPGVTGTGGATGAGGTFTGGATGSHGVVGTATGSTNNGVVGTGITGGAGVAGTGGASGPGGKFTAGNGGSPVTGSVNLVPQAAPSAPVDGDTWVETTSNTLKSRINATTQIVFPPALTSQHTDNTTGACSGAGTTVASFVIGLTGTYFAAVSTIALPGVSAVVTVELTINNVNVSGSTRTWTDAGTADPIGVTSSTVGAFTSGQTLRLRCTSLSASLSNYSFDIFRIQ